MGNSNNNNNKEEESNQKKKKAKIFPTKKKPKNYTIENIIIKVIHITELHKY